MLADDFEFAAECEEFTRDAPLLRYVAAINHDVSRAEFVAAAVAAGFKKHSATARFHESRRFDLAADPALLLTAAGRLIDR